MATLFDRPVICPKLIGRASTLQTLHSSIDQAKSKSGHIVLISGEAGIGKSRLVAEARAYTLQQGFRSLQGNCFQPDIAYPYAPLLDLLRPSFAADHSDLNTSLSPLTLRQLSCLFPDLFPQLEAISEAEYDKHRLFAALLQVFAALTAQQPLLVIIEDVHWSDDISLEFLHHLARWSRTQPLLVLITYRSDEIRAPLSRWLAQLDRERLVGELALARLTRTEVGELVGELMKAIFELRRPVRAEFLETIQSLTEGNPFFIEEILKSLMVADDTFHSIFYSNDAWDRKALHELHIPRSVQDAVQQRVEQLSQPARQLIVTAAVAGRGFDFALLQALTQHDEDELMGAIKEMIGAQLVIEESAERFAFRHALTREAIYAGLLIRERIILHQRIAEALAQIHANTADSHVTELAYHFYEARQWERAFHTCWRAGEQARQLYAFPAAIVQFTHALDAAKELEIALPLSLLRARGLAFEARGDFEAARLDHEFILQSIQPDHQVKWRALLDLGMLWASRDYVQSGVYYQQALAVAREIEVPSLVAHTLNRLGNWCLNAEQPLEGQAYHQEALTIFQALGDRSGLAETFDLLGLANYGSGDLIQGAEYLGQSVSLFRELEDQAGLASSLTILVLCRHENYDTMTLVPAKTSAAQALHEGELALKIAREIGWRAQEAFAGTQLGMCLGIQGEYERALNMAQTGLRIAEEIEHQQWMTNAHRVVGGLYFDLLAFPLAQQHLERALALAHEIGSSLWVGITSAQLVSIAVGQGDFARAVALLESLMNASRMDGMLFGARAVEAARAELALATGDVELALQIADQLTGSAKNSSSQSRIPYLLRLRGEALIGLNRWSAAQAALEAAKAEAIERGLRPLLWRIEVSLAKLYQAQMLPEEAEAAWLAAQQIIKSLAAGISDEALRIGFLQGATALLPPLHPPSARQAIQKQFGGLTPREREVARQMIEGKSNRAIAEQLFVSERTIESHISSIFSKLGFTSRAQIAVWAVEKGL